MRSLAVTKRNPPPPYGMVRSFSSSGLNVTKVFGEKYGKFLIKNYLPQDPLEINFLFLKKDSIAGNVDKQLTCGHHHFKILKPNLKPTPSHSKATR